MVELVGERKEMRGKGLGEVTKGGKLIGEVMMGGEQRVQGQVRDAVWGADKVGEQVKPIAVTHTSTHT